MNKRAMTLSIVLLVFATLMITVYSLYVYNIREGKIKDVTINNLEEVYVKESLINFYLNEIMDSDNFESKFVKYQDNLKPLLDDVKYSVNGNNIVFDVNIKQSNDNLAVSYNYKKTFINKG